MKRSTLALVAAFFILNPRGPGRKQLAKYLRRQRHTTHRRQLVLRLVLAGTNDADGSMSGRN